VKEKPGGARVVLVSSLPCQQIANNLTVTNTRKPQLPTFSRSAIHSHPIIFDGTTLSVDIVLFKKYLANRRIFGIKMLFVCLLYAT
jgi:hypothetical protein